MKLIFEVKDVGDNNFKAFPLSIEACCSQSMLWFMRGGEKNWNVANSFIIVAIDDEKRSENYYHCQFCGKKHETQEKQEKQDKRDGHIPEESEIKNIEKK